LSIKLSSLRILGGVIDHKVVPIIVFKGGFVEDLSMVCLPSDDILGSTGVSVLLTLTTPTTLEDVAQRTGLPLFRVRGTVRRLLEAGFTHQVNQMYEITAAGMEKLEKNEHEGKP
jgi:hypothetical protein